MFAKPACSFWAPHCLTFIYIRFFVFLNLCTPSLPVFKTVVFWSLFSVHYHYHYHSFPLKSTLSSYFRLVILVSKDWIRFLASSFQCWVLFCCAVRRRVKSALELRLHSSSSRTRASSPCSFRLYSCSICEIWDNSVRSWVQIVTLLVQNLFW